MTEVEEFFAEPVELTEDTNDDLGQLLSTWESIEDPDDVEDLAAQTLFVQFYSGSPIEGSAFIDPAIFDSVTTIDGVGDLAYTPDATPNDYYFVDGPVAGSLSFRFRHGRSRERAAAHHRRRGATLPHLPRAGDLTVVAAPEAIDHADRPTPQTRSCGCAERNVRLKLGACTPNHRSQAVCAARNDRSEVPVVGANYGSMNGVPWVSGRGG